MEKYTIKCTGFEKHHTCVFNVAYVGVCECNCMPFQSRHVIFLLIYIEFFKNAKMSKMVLRIGFSKREKKLTLVGLKVTKLYEHET